MDSSAIVTVFKCPCGTYIPSPEGIDSHLHLCKTFQEEANKVVNSTSNLSGMNDDSVDVGTLVDFKLPVLLLERCKDPSKEALPSTLPTSGPRRSSMRISGKRKRTPLKVHDSSIDSCEENSDGANYSHSESEVDDKFESSFSRCKVPVKRFRRKFSDFSNTSQQIADRLYKYKCTKCPTKFKMQKEYHWHMLNIHGDGSKNSEILTCPLCGRMVNRRLLFFNHLKNHENAEALEDAFDLWNNWPEKKREYKHKGKGNQLNFNCKYCLIPHPSQFSFLTHMKQEHPDKGRFAKYLCPYCGISEFDSMKGFLTHFRTLHKKDYYGETIKWSVPFSEHTKQEGRPKIQCNICQKMVDMYYLRDHKKKLHSNKDAYESVKDKDKIEADGFFRCPVQNCHSKFKSKMLLKHHFILHLENNPYKCPFPGCQVKCDAQCHLNRHIKLHTSKPIVCPKCKVSYSRIDKLKTHKCNPNQSNLRHRNSTTSNLRIKRIKLEPESNNQPGFSSPESWSYERKNININHIIATDPVFLQVCKDYPEFKGLIIKHKGHSRSHHRFKCTNCASFFLERKPLERHQKKCLLNSNLGEEQKYSVNDMKDKSIIDSAEKVGCPICGDSFPTLNLLECHVDSEHDHNEIFRCPKCSNMYTSKKTRDKHVQVHNDRHGSKSAPTKCSKCHKILYNSCSLARHWRLIHGTKLMSVLPTPCPSPKESCAANKIQRKKISTKRKPVKKLPSALNKTLSNKVKNDTVDINSLIDNSIIKIETEPELTINFVL